MNNLMIIYILFSYVWVFLALRYYKKKTKPMELLKGLDVMNLGFEKVFMAISIAMMVIFILAPVFFPIIASFIWYKLIKGYINRKKEGNIKKNDVYTEILDSNGNRISRTGR